MKMRLLSLCALLLLAWSCEEKEELCCPADRYTPVGEGFYTDSVGDLHQKVFIHTSLEPKEGYYCFRNVPEIDVDSWEYLFFMYHRDKRHIYFERITSEGKFIRLLEGANPNTFTAVDSLGWEAYDDDQYWIAEDELEGLDPNNLTRIDDYYLDDDQVFYGRNEIEGVDMRTFEILDTEQNYSRDARYVYWGSEILESADPISFTVESNGYGRDRNHWFKSGDAVKAPEWAALK